MTQLNFKINNFQGPFDLLLHLIQKNEMEIYEINISEITGQYLAYLDEMKELDLEITSEFIVIAATLIEIKSRELLPKIVKEEEEEEDPGVLLKKRLMEYKKIKAAAEYLKGIKQYSGTVFTKKPEVIEDRKEHKDFLINITMLDLYNLYMSLLEKYNSKQNKDDLISDKIAVDLYKIEDKVNEIKAFTRDKKIVDFHVLMNSCSCKLEVVVTFLALLELIKQREILVTQETNFNKILIERIAIDE
ncbi:condensin subunit ScpA [Clostridium amylolyticum]|uniref:Segregation and condensation protein A n=1 Tax=Clostridium amylolyticum TaxID=1121298 RepID=A0A1M6KFK6_9CLOT|nr:segregation/condensation protein A [Clostridium amylolyticum]SHJ57709.1 condensin subunit ScpA [Clostridium amylolyticum]